MLMYPWPWHASSDYRLEGCACALDGVNLTNNRTIKAILGVGCVATHRCYQLVLIWFFQGCCSSVSLGTKEQLKYDWWWSDEKRETWLANMAGRVIELEKIWQEIVTWEKSELSKAEFYQALPVPLLALSLSLFDMGTDFNLAFEVPVECGV